MAPARATPLDGDHVMVPSYCRFCHMGCPILVEVDDDGRAVRVTGDDSNDVYHGYTCVKGRALPEQHNHPGRLLHSQKRMPDGSFRAISSEQVMDEIAERLLVQVERYGPDSLAFYKGTMSLISPAIMLVFDSFIRAVGSSMVFTPNTIDQPGKIVARALLGRWSAPPHDFDDPDVSLVLGANPLVSYSTGLPFGHPGKWLDRWFANGFELIVVDPRRSDFAKRATLHLQPRPGHDVAILAAMLRVILSEGLQDQAFIDGDVAGVDDLRRAVEPFTPERVADLADLEADDLVRAARMFARGRRGVVSAGTGPNMAGRGTLLEYLVLAMNTVCGRWTRAGDEIRVPATLAPSMPAKAQATPPMRAYDLTDPLPGTGLRGSMAGLPTGAAPAAMMHEGDDRVRGLISVSGNPAAAWPDQLTAIEGLRELDLLVQVDIQMSATAQLADYVVAPAMSLEMPSFTLVQDSLSHAYIGTGYGEPWAQYTEAVASRPAGSDLLDEWEFLYGVAKRMGLPLELGSLAGASATPIPLDMEVMPTTEALLEMCVGASRLTLDEVRAHPHGAVFAAEPPLLVGPKDPDCTARLDVGNAQMMTDLAEVAAESADDVELTPDGERLPYRFVCRRLQQAYNSSGRSLYGMRGRPYNPAFMHPDDLEELGLARGDLAEIRSARAAITAIVEPDATLRRGLVSMTHAFGGLTDGDEETREVGANVGRLLTVESGLEPYTGQPRMSNEPVAVTPVAVDA